jgi:hypothetical protein
MKDIIVGKTAVLPTPAENDRAQAQQQRDVSQVKKQVVCCCCCCLIDSHIH